MEKLNDLEKMSDPEFEFLNKLEFYNNRLNFGRRIFCTSTGFKDFNVLQGLVIKGLVRKYQRPEDKLAGDFYNFEITSEGSKVYHNEFARREGWDEY